MDAPTPRTADGKPDFSGMWMRANSGPPRGGGRGGRQGEGGGAPAGRGGARPRRPAPRRPGRTGAGRPRLARQPAGGDTDAAFGGQARGGVPLEPPTTRSRSIPTGPPVATFFEAGGNMEGGLPYTPWAAEIRKQRLALNARDNPDAMCLPMGFLQFHQQPQPRRIYPDAEGDPDRVRGELRLRHIYLDGRKLPPQGEPQPWWYGYSVGRWEGDTLVVETNNLRGAEDGPYDGWMDVNGSPYSQQAKFTERFRRLNYGQLQIDLTSRGPEGVHQAVDRARRSAHRPGRRADRVRLQREPAVPPQDQDRLATLTPPSFIDGG